MDKRDLNYWIEHFATLTLAEAVAENLQYFDEKKQQFLKHSLFTEQLFDKEIKLIDEALKRHSVDVYGIRDPFRLIKLNDEDMNDLVAHGYYGTITGEDDLNLEYAKDPYLVGVQQAFRESVHLLTFTNELLPAGGNPDRDKLFWLEGILYLIRGGNIAYYHEWLKRQKKYFVEHGKILHEEKPAATEEEDATEYVFDIKNASHQFVLLWALGIIQQIRDKHSALSGGEQAAIIAAVMNRKSDEEKESVRKHLSNVGTGKANDPLTRTAVRAVKAELARYGIESPYLPEF